MCICAAFDGVCLRHGTVVQHAQLSPEDASASCRHDTAGLCVCRQHGSPSARGNPSRDSHMVGAVPHLLSRRDRSGELLHVHFHGSPVVTVTDRWLGDWVVHRVVHCADAGWADGGGLMVGGLMVVGTRLVWRTVSSSSPKPHAQTRLTDPPHLPSPRIFLHS